VAVVQESAAKRVRNPGLVLASLAGAAPIAMLIANVPRVASTGGSQAIVTMFVMVAFAAVVCALSVSSAASMISADGGSESFVDRTFGRVAGRTNALITAIGSLCVEVSLAGALGYAAHDTVRSVWKLNIPWPIFAVVGLLLAGVVAHFRYSFGWKPLAFVVAGQLVLLVIVDLAILVRGAKQAFVVGDLLVAGNGFDGGALNPRRAFEHPGAAGLAAALVVLLGLWSWMGAAFSSGTVHRARPRLLTGWVLLALGVLYAVTAWLTTNTWGSARNVIDAGTLGSTFFAVPSTSYAGAIVTDLLRLLVVVGLLTAIVVFHGHAARAWAAADLPKLPPTRINLLHTLAALAFAATFMVGARSEFQPDFSGVYLQPAILAAVLLMIRQIILSIAIIKRSQTDQSSDQSADQSSDQSSKRATGGSTWWLAMLAVVASMGLMALVVSGTQTVGATRLTQSLSVIGFVAAAAAVIASIVLARLQPHHIRTAADDTKVM
jgi:hypothetical protein